jgi:thiol-disulfide isomerase/thioredoxin
MKNVLTAILALCLSHFVQEGTAQISKTNFKGSIANPQRDFFLLKHLGRTDTVKLGKDGTFDLLIEQSSANYFTLEYNRQSISVYLLPADEVTFTSSGVNISDATISGASAPYCNHLLQRTQEDRAFTASFPSYKLPTIAADRYFVLRDSVRNARMSLLASAHKAAKLITPFREIEEKIYALQMGVDLITYKNQVMKSGMTVMPNELEKFIQGIDLGDESVAYDPAYISFALNKASLEANVRFATETDKSAAHFYEIVVAVIGEWIKPERNKSVLISEFMPQVLKDAGASDLTSFIRTLERVSKDEKLIASVKKYAAQFEHLYPGRPAPDAEFYNAEGVTSKLSDYRGKVVYIDAWATWCGPCKREIPFLKTLEEANHGKNIQFISVSTDKDVAAWRSFIAKENMGGLQLHQSQEVQKTISQLYAVNSIPRFILIDEEGKIVSSDAPRPSSGEEIQRLLDRVLND